MARGSSSLLDELVNGLRGTVFRFSETGFMVKFED